MRIRNTSILAALMALGAATGPAAEDKVWTTFTFGTPGTLAVSTTDPDSETIESLAAIYGITFVETTATLEPVATGVKHIILRDVDAGGRVTKGVGPTALNNCTAFASNPGFPFQITNANLPYAQDFNLTPTTDAEDWRGGCIDGLSSGDGKEAFVQFTPSVTGQYLITGHFYRDATPSTARAANVSVWELPGCTGSQPSSGASTLVGCNTDLFGNSQIVVTLNAGTTYYVIQDDQFGSSVEDTARIRVSGPLPPPAGQNCASAIDLSVESWAGFTTNADSTPNPDQGDSATACNTSAVNPGPDVWFKLPAVTGGQTYELDLIAGTMTDTIATLYTGSCGSLVEAACNDDKDIMDTMSKITFTALAGHDYYLQIESWS